MRPSTLLQWLLPVVSGGSWCSGESVPVEAQSTDCEPGAIVVARHTIPQSHRMTLDDLRCQVHPESYVHSLTVRTLADAVGSIAVRPLYEDEPIRTCDVVLRTDPFASGHVGDATQRIQIHVASSVQSAQLVPGDRVDLWRLTPGPSIPCVVGANITLTDVNVVAQGIRLGLAVDRHTEQSVLRSGDQPLLPVLRGERDYGTTPVEMMCAG